MIYAFAQMFSLVGGHAILKYGFLHHNAFHVLMYMYLIAGFLILLAIAMKPRTTIEQIKSMLSKGQRLMVLALLLLFFFNAMVFYAALYYIGLSGVAVIGRLTPVLLAMSGVVLFAEHLSIRKIIPLSVTIAGTMLFAFSDVITGQDHIPLNLLGVGFSLMAVLSWVAANIVMKYNAYSMNGPGFVMLRTPFMLLCFGGSFVVMTLAGWVPPLAPLETQTQDWIVFAGAALCLPLLPYLLFPIVLRKVDLSVMSVTLSIQPVIGFGLGLLLFHEPVTDLKLIAALITLAAGIWYSVLETTKVK